SSLCQYNDVWGILGWGFIEGSVGYYGTARKRWHIDLRLQYHFISFVPSAGNIRLPISFRSEAKSQSRGLSEPVNSLCISSGCFTGRVSMVYN
ncbi:hypothetical protein BDZ94DRAFT_1249220, partial [Collybia nuda]